MKFRATEGQGWIALMAASGGKAGIVNIGSEKHTELNDLAWSATPGGNPQPRARPAADYTNHQKMLITATKGVYELLTDGGTFRTRQISTERSVKSYVKHSSGEVVSVKGDGTQPREWANKTVRFSASPDRTRSGAQFYKARIWTTAFQ